MTEELQYSIENISFLLIAFICFLIFLQYQHKSACTIALKWFILAFTYLFSIIVSYMCYVLVYRYNFTPDTQFIMSWIMSSTISLTMTLIAICYKFRLVNLGITKDWYDMMVYPHDD